jgi:uncharacterized protein YeaO (DUF488 family)
MADIFIKRIYEKPTRGDGFRILVDRLWPRGVKKADAAIDVWMKDVAPSAGLRKWFDHDSGKWHEFATAYKKELKNSRDVPALLKYISEHPTVTLLYGAKDEQHNQAVVLKEFLEHTLKK